MRIANPSHRRARLGAGRKAPVGRGASCIATALCACALSGAAVAEPGVGADVIRVGGVMDLKGDSRGLGLGMKLDLSPELISEKTKELKQAQDS